MRNKPNQIQKQERFVFKKASIASWFKRSKKLLYWRPEFSGFLWKASPRKQRERSFFNTDDGLGNQDSGNSKSISSNNSSESSISNKTDSLKEQIESIKKDFRVKVRKFALRVRFIVVFILSIALLSDLISGVYNLYSGLLIAFILISYCSVVLLMYFKKYPEGISLSGDVIYISSEIIATVIALNFWPAGRDAVYTSSLLIFLNFLILFSAMSGKWWYPIYSAIIISCGVAFLQYSQYPIFYMLHKNLPIVTAMPSSQIPWSLVYYLLTGGLVGYFFWNVYNMQSEYLKLKTEDLLAKTYKTFIIPDGEHHTSNFTIRKISHLPDSIVGADFCSYRLIEDGLLICFGDAAGHGVNHSPAAIMCLTVFNSSSSGDPQTIMSEINRVMYRNNDEAYCLIIKVNLVTETFTVTGKCEDMGIILPSGDMIPVPMKSKAIGTEPEYIAPISMDYQFPIGSKLVLRTDGALYSDNNDDQTTLVLIRNS